MNEFHPAKNFKFCPFCGASNFAWDGEKSFSCSACHRKFYINMSAACAALIFNANNELLLTRRNCEPAKGLLDLPGGFVDLGESVEHAIIREVKEELNIDVYDLSLFGTFPNQYVFDNLTYFTEDAVFFCKADDFSQISAQDDVCEFVFKKVEDIDISEIGLQSIKNVIAKLKTENIV